MRREENNPDTSIQRADPGARARALWLIAAVVVVGLVVFFVQTIYEQESSDWLKGIAIDLVSRPNLMFLVLFFTMLPLVGVSIYIFVQGSRIVKSKRMPYPGQKVVKDTPVIEGDKAVQRGRAIQVIAVAMGLVSLALPFIPLAMMAYLSNGT